MMTASTSQAKKYLLITESFPQILSVYLPLDVHNLLKCNMSKMELISFLTKSTHLPVFSREMQPSLNSAHHTFRSQGEILPSESLNPSYYSFCPNAACHIGLQT